MLWDSQKYTNYVQIEPLVKPTFEAFYLPLPEPNATQKQTLCLFQKFVFTAGYAGK